MVPIRFVSEALGAQVGWFEADRLVQIEMAPNLRPQRLRETAVAPSTEVASIDGPIGLIARRDEVVPIVLDQGLDSRNNSKGDSFIATVRTEGKNLYGSIPRGTKVYGHIAEIVQRKGSFPEVMDLAFDKFVFPDGSAANLHGTLISLDEKHVTTRSDGTLEVLNSKNHMAERMVFAGYGDGGGRLLPILEKSRLDGTDHNDVMGFLVTHVKSDEQIFSDIKLDRGTQMGVRITARIVAGGQ
jgi:hypothetical protein